MFQETLLETLLIDSADMYTYILHTYQKRRRGSELQWYTRYRVAKTHRIPYIYRSFSAKVTYICGSFVENDLQLRGSYESSPPCKEGHFENAIFENVHIYQKAPLTHNKRDLSMCVYL